HQAVSGRGALLLRRPSTPIRIKILSMAKRGRTTYWASLGPRFDQAYDRCGSRSRYFRSGQPSARVNCSNQGCGPSFVFAGRHRKMPAASRSTVFQIKCISEGAEQQNVTSDDKSDDEC